MVFGKTRDELIDRLPAEVVKILCTGSEEEIGRLSRYLSVYAELLEGQD